MVQYQLLTVRLENVPALVLLWWPDADGHLGALGLPGFFLSTARESLVVSFSFLNVVLKFSSNFTNALDIP